MRVAGARIALGLLTVVLTGCAGAGRAPAQSPDRVKILSVSPPSGTVLRAGDQVPFRVEVEYTLDTAETGTITLVIQQGQSGLPPLANDTHVIQKGSGKLVLERKIDVPDVSAVQLFTPLSPQGATSTTVVDTRAYAVAKQ